MLPVGSPGSGGRRLASKACDRCRLRKVQCTLPAERASQASQAEKASTGSAASCRRCLDAKVECTFISQRKQRGPVSRRATAAAAVPIGELCIEHLCPPTVFHSIIDDYVDLVYPLLPLVHRPTFRALLRADTHAADAAFFRLCLAVCAVTVASLPRKFDEYAQGRYSDVGAMVDRACHIVLASRIASEPEWQNRPSMSTMIASTMLAMASHYAGRGNQGWGYASEATQFFRALELYRKEAYDGLTVLEGELCKRAFWVLYIIQIHDRLSYMVPHTGLSFDPLRTDWEFLLPLEADDEDLHKCTDTLTEFSDRLQRGRIQASLPVISGFVALIKVFLCVVDLLSHGFPGSPPQAYAMTSGTLRPLIYPDNPVDVTHPPGAAPSKSTISLSALLRIIRKLQRTLDELPDELKISTLDPQLQASRDCTAMSLSLANQFDIMRANIHITSLYIQSTILEACSSAFTRPESEAFTASPSDDTRSSPGYTPRTQLWMFRKSIAQELLEVLNFCTSRTLEANGSSMIVKIREIAATLLDIEGEGEITSEHEEQSRQYVAQFADILANLDYMGQATIIPPIFSAH